MVSLIMEIEDYINRWKKHKNIINKLEKSNLSKDEIKIWSNQIDMFFTSKIKSKL